MLYPRRGQRVAEKKAKSAKKASATTLAAISKKHNIPVRILSQVKKRGMGAYYSSGSRPGVTANQWAMGRVKSFATGRGGARKADADLWKKVKASRTA